MGHFLSKKHRLKSHDISNKSRENSEPGNLNTSSTEQARYREQNAASTSAVEVATIETTAIAYETKKPSEEGSQSFRGGYTYTPMVASSPTVWIKSTSSSGVGSEVLIIPVIAACYYLFFRWNKK